MARWSKTWLVLGLSLPLSCGDDLPDAITDDGGPTSLGGSGSTGPWGMTGPLPLPTTENPPDPDSDGTTSTSTSTSTPGTESSESTMGLDATFTGTTTLSDEGTTNISEESSTGPIAVEPTAEDDVACTVRGEGPLEVSDVLANDTDPQGSVLTIVSADAATAQGGTAMVMGDSILYTPPNAEFWGEDWLTYTIEDPEGNPDSAELHVMVWPGTIPTAEIDAGVLGVTISPEANNGRAGWAVHGAGGDFNGDGFHDILVSAPFAQAAAGRIYAVFGGAGIPSVDLADMAAGVGGFSMDGEHPNAFAGWSLTTLPDVNGDGRDEIVVGSGWASFTGGQSGRAYVVFGPAMPSSMLLSDLNMGGGGYIIEGTGDGSWTGWSVSATPDMNGDGLWELLVGSPHDITTHPNSGGWAYAVWGKDTTTPVLLSDLQMGMPGGFAINGQPGDHIGFSVEGLSDINGDGLGDLMVGSEFAVGQAGRVYIAEGKGDELLLDLTAVAMGLGGILIEGASSGDVLGRSVTQGGDYNGNGVPDVLLGAPADPGQGLGHLIYDDVGTNLVIGPLDPTEGVSWPSPDLDDRMGWSVDSIGDFNHDGWRDLALGAPTAEFAPGAESGRVYVVFGRPDMSLVDLADIAQGRGGFVFEGDEWLQGTGGSVSSAGDFNGDGADDLLVGAGTAGAAGPDGRAYVVYGVPASTPEVGACIPAP